MIKRITALLLSFVFVFSVAVCSVYAEDESVNAKEKLNILIALDIIESKDADKMSLFDYAGKTEFIGYICRMIGAGRYTEGDTRETLEFAHNMGIIKSATENVGGQLKYDEALTMLVRAAGYEFHAEQSGGFPHGYVMLASNLGITEGFKGNTDRYLKVYEAINLIYNMLDVGMANIDSMTTDGVNYSSESVETVLEAYRDVYKVEGVVEATETTALYSNIAPRKGYIIIGGEEYRGSVSEELLGYKVTAVVEENNDEKYVLGFVTEKNKTFVLEGKDIVKISSDFRLLTYIDENDKEKTANISPAAAVVLNGLPSNEYKTSDFKPEDGNIVLIDRNNDSVYDTVSIKNYKTVVVNMVSEYNEKIGNVYTYDADNTMLDLKTDGEEDFVKILKDGKEIKISDINRLDVVRVLIAEQGNQKRIIAEVSSDTVEGTVNKMTEKDGETVVTVGGRELKTARSYDTALQKGDTEVKKISVGGSYVMRLDSTGKIAYADTSSENMTYAVVKQVGREQGIDETYKVKLFTQNAEWKTLQLRDKVTYNGDKLNASVAAGKIGEFAVAGSSVLVIGYKLDGEGKISVIEAGVTNPTSDERINMQRNLSCTYQDENASLQAQLFMAPNPIIWCITQDKMSEDSAFTVRTASEMFTDNYGYTLDAYDVDEYGFAKMLVVYESDGLLNIATYEKAFFIVDSVGETVLFDGDVKYHITGSITTYNNISGYTEDADMVAGLKKGDIISLALDKQGNISKVSKYWSIEDDGKAYKNAGDLWASPVIIGGKIKKADTERKFISVDCGEKDWTVRTTAGPSVLIYNTERGTVQKGSLNDLTEGSFIVAKINYYKLKSVVVIN